jgi:hypothetical protein
LESKGNVILEQLLLNKKNMKNYYLFLSIVLFLGCKKDNKSITPIAPTPTTVSLINLWESQINISDTYTNDTLTNGDTTYDAPNESWVRFNSNNTYIEYQNMISTDTGTYTYNSSQLSLISGIDTTKYVTTLTSNSLILRNIEINFSGIDTIKFDTKLTFRKI